MSVERQANLLGQQRIDIPHLRAVESSIAADFDLLAGQIMAGGNAYVVSGFYLTVLAPGAAANTLKLNVASSVLLHPDAAESGTIFTVPSNRAAETLNAANTRVSGSFTAATVNYIGIDLRRTADASTSDLVQFLDANTNIEKPKTVPLARTLDYIVIISTQDFSTTPGIAPLAKVTTDANNNIVSIEDARNFFLRLGSGGTVTNTKFSYAWPGGRGEPIGALANTSFSTGDKAISSLKEWMNAIMSRIWELGGGEYWYSATADRNVKMARMGSPPFSNGDWFTWDGTHLQWQSLRIVFDNSTGSYNDVRDQLSTQLGLTDLIDGECIYVDLDRTQNRTSPGNPLIPVKAALTNLSYPSTPGQRLVLAWRVGNTSTCIVTRDSQFPVNASLTPATISSNGVVRLLNAPGSSSAPVVPNLDSNGRIANTATGGAGATGTAFYGTGFTGCPGITGIGGATGGAGGVFQAGAGGNAYGVTAQGTGTSAGIQATGGVTDGDGVQGIGQANGRGVFGTGSGTGAGCYGQGGATSAIGVYGIGGNPNGTGVKGQGAGTGPGVIGWGGASSGPGGSFSGGATNGDGVQGFALGTGAGGTFQASTGAGPAIIATQGSGNSKPLVQYKSAGGSPRVSFDWLGHDTCETFKYQYLWNPATAISNANASTISDGWSWSASGAGATVITQSIGNTTYGRVWWPYARINHTASTNTSYITPVTAITMPAGDTRNGLAVSVAWTAAVAPVVGAMYAMGVTGSGNAALGAGISALANGDKFIGFIIRSGVSTTWWIVAHDGVGAATYTDTTIAYVANTPTRFRVEYLYNPEGVANYYTYFYINGARVGGGVAASGSGTFRILSAATDKYQPYFFITNTAGAQEMNIFPVKVQYTAGYPTDA